MGWGWGWVGFGLSWPNPQVFPTEPSVAIGFGLPDFGDQGIWGNIHNPQLHEYAV